jgi:hypothetical protein
VSFLKKNKKTILFLMELEGTEGRGRKRKESGAVLKKGWRDQDVFSDLRGFF